MDAVRLSVDRFCLLAGVEALAEMMEEDATTVCGSPKSSPWEPSGLSLGPYADLDRLPRRQSESGSGHGFATMAGKEVSIGELAGACRDGNLLLEWALNLMV